MTRSEVLYHTNILREKRAAIKKATTLINKGQSKLMIDAEQLQVVNKECEGK